MKYEKPCLKQIIVNNESTMKNGPDSASCSSGSCCYRDDEKSAW